MGVLLILLLFFLFFVVLVAFIGGVVYLVFYIQKSNRKAFQALAQQLGLQYVPASFMGTGRINGTYYGFQVEIYTYQVGRGEHSETWTRVCTYFPMSLNLGMRISREGIFSGFGKLFGFQDIQVGDPAFDSRFTIKGRNESQVRGWLDSRRQRAIYAADQALDGIELEDAAVNKNYSGVEKDLQRIQRTLAVQNQLLNELRNPQASAARRAIPGYAAGV